MSPTKVHMTSRDLGLGTVAVQLHVTDVLLVGTQHQVGQAGGAAQRYGQHSAHVRVQGAAVTDPVHLQDVPAPKR